jgi:hypothetical protein
VIRDLDTATWLSLSDAADRLGLSRPQLRRRIKAGQITSRQVQGPHGLAYEVCLNGDDTVPSASRQADDRHRDKLVTVTPPLTELVNLLAGTQAELVRTTAAAAMWQARAEMLAGQVERLQLALEAPKPTMSEVAPQHNSEGLTVEPTPPRSSETPQARPWWAFWR